MMSKISLSDFAFRPRFAQGRLSRRTLCVRFAFRLLCALLIAGIVGCSAPNNPKYKRLKASRQQPRAEEDAQIREQRKVLATQAGKYSADERFKMAKILWAKGKGEEAVKELKACLDINNKHQDAMIAIAQIHLGLRNHNGVRDWTQAVLSINPRNAEAHSLRALSSEARGLKEDAEKEWKAALSLASNNPRIDLQARQSLLDLYWGSPLKYEEGLKLCEASLAKYPKSLLFLIWKGDYLGKLGRRDEAIKLYDAAMEKMPDNAELHRRVAEFYVRRNIEPERALKAAQRVVQLAPKEPNARVLLGKVLLWQNKPDEALNAFQQAKKLTKLPNLALAEVIAGVLVRKNQIAEAEQELQSVVDAYPGRYEPRLVLATFYVQQRRREKALEQCKKALEVNPKSAASHFLMGDVYTNMGDRRNAINAYEEGLKIRPDATLPTNNLAYLYAEEKTRLDYALKLAERASKAAKDPAPFLDTVGFVHYQREDYAKALEYFARAKEKMDALIAQNPKLQYNPAVHNPTILYHLAMTYHKKGQKQEAIAELEEALRVGSELKQRGGEFKEKEEAEKLLQELKGA